VGVVATCYCPPQRVVLDRPFLLALRDDASGTILFLAKVRDPSAA
jgi:serine protease inhibitor